MIVNYVCRHCRTFLGRIDSAAITEERLGFHSLTPAERRDIITYNSGGEVIVKVICEHCTQALENNPELNLLVNPLQ